MGFRILKHAFLGLLFSAIPAFCSYIASSDVFLTNLQAQGILGESVNIPFLQDTMLWIGIILSVGFLGGSLAICNIIKDSMMEQRNALIQMNKTILASALSRCVGLENIDFDVRIFVPKHPGLYNMAKFLHINMAQKFVIRNIALIAQPGTTKKLQFEVFPKTEGLVGLCYKTKAMMYDDDLMHTNSVRYSLGQNQIDQTSNLMWSICCPILREDNTVHAIIALDGKRRITLSESAMQGFRQDIIAFSRLLYDAVPQLFR